MMIASTLAGVPVFSVHPRPEREELAAGTSTSRNCSATGNPRPVLAWERDGAELLGGDILTRPVDEFSVVSTLRIGPSVPQSEGVYRCFAPDGNGSVVYSTSSEILFTCKGQLCPLIRPPSGPVKGSSFQGSRLEGVYCITVQMVTCLFVPYSTS